MFIIINKFVKSLIVLEVFRNEKEKKQKVSVVEKTIFDIPIPSQVQKGNLYCN